MCDRCVVAAREKYALLRIVPPRDPMPRDVAPRGVQPTRKTMRRFEQRERARRLAAQIGA